MLRLPNLLNSSPTGGGGVKSLSPKKTKRGQRKIISHFQLFQQVQFVNFYIYITCRLQKPRKPLQGSFFNICVYQPGGKTLAILQ